MLRTEEKGRSRFSHVHLEAVVDHLVNDVADQGQVLPRPLESGKEKRHLEEQQYDEPRTGFSVPKSSDPATPSAQFLGHDTSFSNPPGALSSEPAGTPR